MRQRCPEQAQQQDVRLLPRGQQAPRRLHFSDELPGVQRAGREVVLSQQTLSLLEVALGVFVSQQRARLVRLLHDPGHVARASVLRIEAQLVLLTRVQWSLVQLPISTDLSCKEGNAGMPLRLSIMELATVAMAVQRLLHEPACHCLIAERMRWPPEQYHTVAQHLRLLRACLPTMPLLMVP